MDKNLPASAEDAGSIPCPGRFHMLPATEAHVPQLLELKCSRDREPQLMRPCAAAPEASAQTRVASACCRESPCTATKT